MSRKRKKEPQGQSNAVGKEARDPRTEEVIQTLQEIGHIMGRQAKEKAATFAKATEFAAAASMNGNNAIQGQGQMARNRTMHKLVEQFLQLQPPLTTPKQAR